MNYEEINWDVKLRWTILINNIINNNYNNNNNNNNNSNNNNNGDSYNNDMNPYFNNNNSVDMDGEVQSDQQSSMILRNNKVVNFQRDILVNPELIREGSQDSDVLSSEELKNLQLVAKMRKEQMELENKGGKQDGINDIVHTKGMDDIDLSLSDEDDDDY